MRNITSIRYGLLGFLGLLALGTAGCSTSRPTLADVEFKAPLKKIQVTSNFGTRRGRPHKGVDFAARKGTPVYVSAKGKVTFSGRQKGFGKLVIVRHADGIETYYAHLSRRSVRRGKRLKSGQKLGLAGKTGNVTGAHLHFEIRHRGQPVNPLPFIAP